MRNLFFTFILSIFFLGGCTPSGPEPVKLQSDMCSECKMSISDLKFAAQAISKKGKHYKFDDLVCMVKFEKANAALMENARFYVTDFADPQKWIETKQAVFIQGGTLQSPMLGNTAAFNNQVQAKQFFPNIEQIKSIDQLEFH